MSSVGHAVFISTAIQIQLYRKFWLSELSVSIAFYQISNFQMFTDAPGEYIQLIQKTSIQEKNPNQMLMKILVFCVEKCSKMGVEGNRSSQIYCKRIICLSLGNELYHCSSLLIPDWGKRPISNVLNQSLIISLSMCSWGVGGRGKPWKIPKAMTQASLWVTVISGIYDNSSSRRKMKLIETNPILYIHAIWIQGAPPVTKWHGKWGRSQQHHSFSVLCIF